MQTNCSAVTDEPGVSKASMPRGIEPDEPASIRFGSTVCPPKDSAGISGTGCGTVALAAELLVRFASPGTGARLVDEHGPDGSGHCRGCPRAVTSGPVFPCRLRLIGEVVVEMDTRMIGAVA